MRALDGVSLTLRCRRSARAGRRKRRRQVDADEDPRRRASGRRRARFRSTASRVQIVVAARSRATRHRDDLPRVQSRPAARRAAEYRARRRAGARPGSIDDAALRARARSALARTGRRACRSTCRSRSSRSAQQQSVEIAKALVPQRADHRDGRADGGAHGSRDRRALRDHRARCARRGAGIIYISHRMEELSRIADRITVMRDGKRRRNARGAQISRRTISFARWSAARSTRTFPNSGAAAGRARACSTCAACCAPPHVNGVSFAVRAGEIVGLAGLVGAGRTEIVRAIAGADVPRGGEVSVDGKRVAPATASGMRSQPASPSSPKTARRKGWSSGMTVRENVTLAHLADFVDRDLLIDAAREETRDDANDRRAAHPNAEHRADWCAISPAERSRRSCSRSGCSATRASFSSTSRRAASTSARRRRSTDHDASWPRAERRS